MLFFRCVFFFFFFQAEDGIRDYKVTGVQTCALPILQRRAARHADGEGVVRRRRAVRFPRRLRAGAALQELWRPRGLLREEEAQGQGVRPRREPGGGAPGSRGAGRAAGRAHRLRDPSAAPDRAHAGARRGVSLPAARRPAPAPVAERDELALAMDRACGARPIDGNRIDLYSESPRALDAMLELVARAERWIHFENYIIRGDRTGRRFADALAARAPPGGRARALYHTPRPPRAAPRLRARPAPAGGG